jgi:GT2 family glycosyltransferase
MGDGDEGGCESLPLAAGLDLRPVARWPTRLGEATVAAVIAAPLPYDAVPPAAGAPRASIVVVTLDNLVFNRLCLESLLYSTQDASCEITVVDNCSTDGTAEYLQQLHERNPRLSVIFNDCNMGFAASNNQALSAARGERLVLLNNDTIVPPDWLDRLLAHLDDPRVGLVGPVTNRAGNEAQIETSYRSYGEFLDFAAARAVQQQGKQSELRVATMFCAAMRRAVFEEIGPLDERFEIGLFEDDDYSMRVRAAGYRVVCAEDVFVHHFGQASIGKLAAAGRYGELFHANRQRWEEKWKHPWKPYERRSDPAYEELVLRIRALVEQVLPPGGRVLVISNGDDSLLDISGVSAAHFPQGSSGGYSGHHPAEDAVAIEHLESLRAAGAAYLLVPRTALWWLEYYGVFRKHLEEQYRIVVRQDDTCWIIGLEADPQTRP